MCDFHDKSSFLMMKRELEVRGKRRGERNGGRREWKDFKETKGEERRETKGKEEGEGRERKKDQEFRFPLGCGCTLSGIESEDDLDEFENHEDAFGAEFDEELEAGGDDEVGVRGHHLLR